MAAVATWIATLISNSVNASTFNLGNITVPAGNPTIAILVSLTTSARATVSSATLGGVSMTHLDDAGNGNFEVLASFKLDGVAAGAKNLTVNMSGAIGGSGPPNVAVAVWAISGNASTPFAHGASVGSTSLALNTAASGCAIFAVQGQANPTAFSSATTRSGPTSGFLYDMAGDLATSSQTPHTESAGSSDYTFIGITWQVGTVAYIFTLDTATFTLTGQTNSLVQHKYGFTLGTATFTLTGQALLFGRKFPFLLGTAAFLVNSVPGSGKTELIFKHSFPAGPAAKTAFASPGLYRIRQGASSLLVLTKLTSDS